MAIINGQGRVGIRVTPGVPSYDADAQAFFTAASITDSTQMSAVNTLVITLKSNNLWTKIKALYPIVGGNATAHSYNLINPSLFQITWYGGWTHTSTGALPNGSNGYADTKVIPNTSLSITSNHFSIYSRTNAIGGNYASHGLYEGGSNPAIELGLRRYDSLAYYVTPNESSSSNVVIAPAQTNSAAFYLGSRRSTNDIVLYRNSTIIASNTGTMVGSVQSTNSLYLSAINSNGYPNGVTYDNKEISLSSIGDGLTNIDILNYYTAVQNFQTSLSRQV
jgi:hypothetical protein